MSKLSQAADERRIDPTRCVKRVAHPHIWGMEQCMRKRGHGKDGLYCGPHAAAMERQKKREELYEASIRRRERGAADEAAENAALGAELIERLNEIAEWREANRLLTAERDRLRIMLMPKPRPLWTIRRSKMAKKEQTWWVLKNEDGFYLPIDGPVLSDTKADLRREIYYSTAIPVRVRLVVVKP